MKNLTLALDENLIQAARRIALDRSTTLNAMIREYIEELTRRELHAAKARRRIVSLCKRSRAEVGSKRWTRDELHER